MNKTNVMAKFNMSSDNILPLEDITTAIQLSPTPSWRKVDPIPGRNRHRIESCWTLSTEYEASFDINDQLNKILALLQPKGDILKHLKQKYALNFTIIIVIRVEEDIKPAMYFEKEIIRFLYDMEGEIDIDLYNYS